MRHHTRRCAIALACLAPIASADWVETVNGDLSNDRFNPTLVTLNLGNTLITGTVSSADDDYFRIVVPAGQRIEQVVIDVYAPAGNTSFLGLNTGVTFDPIANAQMLGFVNIGIPSIGTNVLPAIGASNGKFTAPLPAGAYAWWIDEGGAPQAYSLRIVTSQPAPCRPDLTTGAVAGQFGYGLPNGTLNNDDFFYYLAQFAAGNVAVADLTTLALQGTPGYGVPNGVVNNDDFFFYLSIFAAGC